MTTRKTSPQSTSEPLEHDLKSFMRQVHQKIESEYKRISKRTKEDPGTAGDQGEENWAEILRNWLPPYYQIETKGRILSLSAKTSGQLDIIVLRPDYPRHLLKTKLYLAGGVAAVFECKLTLKKEHVGHTVQRAAELRSILHPRIGTPYRELQSPILYGLLSHSWRGKKNARETVDALLEEADRKHLTHPRQMLDLVCIADVGTWTARKQAWSPPVEDPVILAHLNKSPEQDPWLYKAHASTAYIQWGFSERQPDPHPIGTLLSSLMLKLAREDPQMRPLSNYFENALVVASGKGKNRLWDLDIYSKKLRKQLEVTKFSAEDEWSEWSNIYV